MKFIYSMVIALLIFLFSECSSNEVQNHKDLDGSMIDMLMYHDNLGLYLRKSDADYALWLLQGMDSSLQVISRDFTEHRKLRDPFKKSYQKILLPFIVNIKTPLEKNDFPKAIQSYQILTKKCNGCHVEHDVDKEVIDWSKEELHN